MSGTFLNEPQYHLFRRAVSERIAPLVLVAGSGLSAPPVYQIGNASGRTFKYNLTIINLHSKQMASITTDSLSKSP